MILLAKLKITEQKKTDDHPTGIFGPLSCIFLLMSSFQKRLSQERLFWCTGLQKCKAITNTGLEKCKCVNIQNYSHGNHLWTKWKRMVKLKAMPRCLLTIFTEFLLILGLYLDFETLNSTFCNSGGVNCLTSPNLCVLQPTSIPSYSVSSGGLSS